MAAHVGMLEPKKHAYIYVYTTMLPWQIFDVG